MYGLLKSEDPNLAADKMIAKSAFAEMDKNEDGKVSLDEFTAACMGREEFSKMLAVKVIDIFVDDDENWLLPQFQITINGEYDLDSFTWKLVKVKLIVTWVYLTNMQGLKDERDVSVS